MVRRFKALCEFFKFPLNICKISLNLDHVDAEKHENPGITFSSQSIMCEKTYYGKFSIATIETFSGAGTPAPANCSPKYRRLPVLSVITSPVRVKGVCIPNRMLIFCEQMIYSSGIAVESIVSEPAYFVTVDIGSMFCATLVPSLLKLRPPEILSIRP